MKKILLLIFAAILLLPCFSGCDKKDLSVGTGVEFYLLKSVSQTDPSAIETEDRPFIPYSEIQHYNPATYTYKVSKEIRKTYGDNTYHMEKLAGRGFVVKVNGETIYRGEFINPISSYLGTGIKINSITETGDMLVYIIDLPSAGVTDNRNNERILSVLRKDGKLIE